ncbi:GNAT family N-acetyltransferase [Nocardioides sp. LML1-1-1.1]|uniref:GNAT family N-acetyltransferase n=1 Tax=Nocardioides sp. LML1-1-1.1 TaxID=3135248 RepID=UPI003439938B
MTTELVEILDNPAWHSLVGPHSGLAEGDGLARRYRRDISVFHALADARDPLAWADLAALTGPGGEVTISGDDAPPPPGWTVVAGGGGVQLVETPAVAARLDPAAEVLDGSDPAVVAEMLALVERNQPGPFLSGTPRMGTYLGIRRAGRLVAMAGERVHPEGWTEISAVCTDPEFRGQGIAARLVRSVTAGIHARGERALMHAAATNTGAISVYLGLGFELRRHTTFRLLRAPGTAAGPHPVEVEARQSA